MLSGPTFLILVQVVTKLATFALNQVLFRYISPKVIGISTYLEFLVNTLLFFSREAERLANQRTDGSDKDNALLNVVNFGFLPLAIGVPMSLAAFWWQTGTELFQSSILTAPYAHYTVGLVLLSVLCELLIEPVYAVYQYELDFKTRSRIEGTAVLVKCISTFSIVYLSRNKESSVFEGLSILSFAVGQLCYSGTLLVRYYISFKADFPSTKLTPTRAPYSGDPKVWAMWKNLFVQMIFKQFLTEGDKFLINYLCSIEEQGVYSVVTNYGSMAARLLFQPIEESMRMYFTRLLSKSDKQARHQAYDLLRSVCIFYFNLSILIFLGAFTSAPFLLKTLLGRKVSAWAHTNIFEIFPQYILYLPLLAFNGILEAFFSSIATEKDIKNFSYFMTVSSAVVLVSSYVTIAKFHMGLSGLILSNSINMCMRIAYAYNATRKYFVDQVSLLSIFNHIKYSLLLAAISAYVQHYVIFRGETWFVRTPFEFVKCAVLCLCCLSALCFLERRTIVQLMKRKSD